MKKYCETVCQTAKEYIQIALALETLSYHNKNYLDKMMCNDAILSEEIQILLMEAINKINEGEYK